MFYEVVGFRRTSGTSKKTNKDYSGYIVFFKFTQNGVTGCATEQCFISDQLNYFPQIGQSVRLLYNAHGYLIEVEVI